MTNSVIIVVRALSVTPKATRWQKQKEMWSQPLLLTWILKSLLIYVGGLKYWMIEMCSQR